MHKKVSRCLVNKVSLNLYGTISVFQLNNDIKVNKINKKVTW